MDLQMPIELSYSRRLIKVSYDNEEILSAELSR